MFGSFNVLLYPDNDGYIVGLVEPDDSEDDFFSFPTGFFDMVQPAAKVVVIGRLSNITGSGKPTFESFDSTFRDEWEYEDCETFRKVLRKHPAKKIGLAMMYHFLADELDVV